MTVAPVVEDEGSRRGSIGLEGNKERMLKSCQSQSLVRQSNNNV